MPLFEGTAMNVQAQALRIPAKVHTHISGSHCTIQLLPNWELYIEARKDIRLPSFSFIEVVRAGQAIHRESLPNEYAPTKLIELMRRYKPTPYKR